MPPSAVCVFLPAALWLASASALSASTGRTVYVSPTGSDRAAGTLAAPFLTVEHARQAVQAGLPTASGDTRIVLRGGTYRLAAPLTLTAEDSGRNGHRVFYSAFPGEHPILSGGRIVSGWTQHDRIKNIWQASVPGLQTRQLFVNGVRCRRSGTTTLPSGIVQTPTGYTWPNSDLAGFAHPEDLELVYRSQWTSSRLPVQSVSGQAVTLVPGPFKRSLGNGDHTNAAAAGLYRLENSAELLGEPGQFYLNTHAATLSYLPRPGEHMKTATVVAPVLESLVTLAGRPGAPVANVTFSGLQFADTTWLAPSLGFVEVQANLGTHWSYPACAVTVQAGDSVRVENCRFARLGGAGVRFYGGTVRSEIASNLFTDISSAAVLLGDAAQPAPTDPRLIDTDDSIINNCIHDCGAEYPGACAVTVWWAHRSVVAHNTIFNQPYTGISEGWGWGRPNIAQNNRITANLIYKVMQTLNDGGGIYLNGGQPGLIVSGNVVHDLPKTNPGPGGFPASGLYTDDGSQYDVLQFNVVYHCAGFDLHENDNRGDVIIQDNILGEGTNIYEPRDLTGTNGAGPNIYRRNLHAPPSAAPDIVAAAGLLPAYKYLLTAAPY